MKLRFMRRRSICTKSSIMLLMGLRSLMCKAFLYT